MSKFELVRDKNNTNPYDLSAMKWRCKKCGGVYHSGSPYEPIGMRKICTCNRKKR